MRLLAWIFGPSREQTEKETRLALELAEAAEEHAREVERAKEIRTRLQIIDEQMRSFAREVKQKQ